MSLDSATKLLHLRPSDLFRCGSNFEWAFRFLFFSFCFLSSTHRREVKRKEEEPPFFFKWNVGLLESDSLRGHSIKGLKQSNQHTFFNHLQSYKSFIITEYNKLIISSLSTVGNIQPWSCRIFFFFVSFLLIWNSLPPSALSGLLWLRKKQKKNDTQLSNRIANFYTRSIENWIFSLNISKNKNNNKKLPNMKWCRTVYYYYFIKNTKLIDKAKLFMKHCFVCWQESTEDEIYYSCAMSHYR